MTIPRLATRRPVAVAMLFLAVVLLGVISFVRLPIDLLPDVSYPRLVVYTAYPEVGPAEMERLVTQRIEAEGAAVPGVERVTSVSRDGMSLVTLRFAWGTDMDFAMLNVRERMDNARADLPEDVERPRILRVDPDSEPIMGLSVAGGADLWQTKELAETVIRRRLEQLDGVAQASVTGGLEREIHVEVDPQRLESYGLDFQTISQALDRANFSGTGGTILRGRYRFPLRTLGEFRTVGEMNDVVVARQRVDGAGAEGTGAPVQDGFRLVRLRDVAQVTDGFADRESVARYNGSESVGLLVFKESGSNTVAVAERVEEALAQLAVEFPELTVDVAYSQAGFISDSIDNVVQALVLGGVLAFLVLFVFLREPRYPVAVALAIPISVVGTFALMDASGVSLNIMSLGGLALGVGMLVDNSIIVLENVFRHRQEGKGALEAAALGGEEVMGAITAATLTTIAVFGPIIYVEGVAGELFRDLSLAVAFSLLASLLVALTLLPTMAARFRLDGGEADGTETPRLVAAPRPGGRVRTIWWGVGVIFRIPLWLLHLSLSLVKALLLFWWAGIQSFFGRLLGPVLRGFDRGYDVFAERYHEALDWSLDHRGRVLAFAAGGLAAALLLGLWLERDLLPRVDQQAFDVRLELEEGTTLERTAEVSGEIERVLLDAEGVEAVFSQIGRHVEAFGEGEEAHGLHTSRFHVRVAAGHRTEDVVDRVRPVAERYPNGNVSFQTGRATALGQILGGSEADIAVRVRGEDLEAAYALAREIQGRIGASARVGNLRVGTERSQPEIRLEVLREDAARYGIEPQAIAETVESAMRGTRATEFVAFDRKVPVTVRLPDALRHDASTLGGLRVEGVPLRELVRMTEAPGPSEIRREDQGRVVTLYADVISGGLDRAITEVELELAGLPLPPGLRLEVGGENEEMRRSFRDLGLAFALALILVYMILAAQFESFVHPFTILGAVPLAVVGAVLALWLAGEGLNTMSLIGMVILVGIVVNDSIVKVDFIRQARARGLEVRDAILEAGRVRLRPILMTTATTVLGLTPMALGIGRGADLRAPLAVAVIGGLLLATLLTLIVVPVLYSVLDTVRTLVPVRSGRPAPVGGGGPGAVPAARQEDAGT